MPNTTVMTSLKELKKRAGLVARQVEVHKDNFKAALELMQKRKLAKPEFVFRNTVSTIRKNQKYDFLFLDLGQKSYFFMEEVFPMGDELEDKIEETEKLLSKAKKPDEKEFLEQMLFFYEELEDLNPKGFATGIIRLARQVENEETGETEFYMEVRKSSLEVEGTVRKANLVKLVREELDYSLVPKRGGIVFLEEERKPKETSELEEVTKEVDRLAALFKETAPNQAFKKLGIIDKIDDLVKTLEDPPKELITLVEQLYQQQKEFTTTLSEQIDQRLNRAQRKLEKLSTIDSATQLESIFKTVQKMHEGWKMFLDDQEHPSKAIIEKIRAEIDIIKQYEAQLVPLRKQHEDSQDEEQKEQLAQQINQLIQEGKKAVA